MRSSGIVGFCGVLFLLSGFPVKTVQAEEARLRIAIVSSYHRGYLWSQDTHRGVVDALVHFKFLDNEEQAAAYTKNDRAESSRAVVRKLWMDTKRRNSPSQINVASEKVLAELAEFKPDLILLGDDNAANYIGNQYIDTETPVVFWGVNGNPLKYDLLDSIEHPGHNVTGVYQAGYLKETVVWLRKLLPEIHRIAVLSDDSPTGRSKVKELVRDASQGDLGIEVVESVVTNSYSDWQRAALRLNQSVDAFAVLNHNTLKDEAGEPVGQLTAGGWFLRNIRKPSFSHEKQFVEEGIFCVVDDSGFKQGWEAIRIAHRILDLKEDPGEIASYAPDRGAFVVNLESAEMLGLSDLVRSSDLVEERIPKALALAPPAARGH